MWILPSITIIKGVKHPLPSVSNPGIVLCHFPCTGFFLEYNFRGGKSTFLEIEGGINLRGKTIFRGGKTIFRGGGKMPP